MAKQVNIDIMRDLSRFGISGEDVQALCTGTCGFLVQSTIMRIFGLIVISILRGIPCPRPFSTLIGHKST